MTLDELREVIADSLVVELVGACEQLLVGVGCFRQKPLFLQALGVSEQVLILRGADARWKGRWGERRGLGR